MKFYLIRHGMAKKLDYNETSDLERKLTKKGIKELKKLYKLIRKSILPPDLILTSYATRALETSRIISKIWKLDSVKQYKELNPDSSIESYIKVLQENLDENKIIEDFKLAIISHEPDLSLFAYHLLRGKIKFNFKSSEIVFEYSLFEKSFIHLKKGSLMIIDWVGEGGILDIYIPPGVIKK